MSAAARRVAFQGARGAFSEEAAVRLLGKGIEVVPCATFEELYRALGEDRADLVLAPAENSLIGSIHRSQDLLLQSFLYIVGEVIHPVVHCLIACPGASLETIRRVQSHPAALAQCERFFAAYPHFQKVVAEDTAGSVEEIIALGDPTRAAIASRWAGEYYGGSVLLEHLEDHRENYTRFLLLGSEPGAPEHGDKTTLLIRVLHEAGSLVLALEPFARRRINLLKIEGRPVPGHPWEYRFQLDLAGSMAEASMAAALEEVGHVTQEMRVLGCYPSAASSPVAGQRRDVAEVHS